MQCIVDILQQCFLWIFIIFRFRKLCGLIWIIAMSLLVSYQFRDIMEYLWQFKFPFCHTQGDELIRNDSQSSPPQSNLQGMKEKNTAREQHVLYLPLNITMYFCLML